MVKPSITLSAILLLALALRLGMGAYLGFNAPPDQAACGADTVEFENMAWSVAQGAGFTLYPGGPPTAFRAPGYPLLLAGLYALFGRVYWINRLALSLIGTGTCWLVYVLALRLQLRRAVALLAACLTAVLPLQFYWCGHFMSEPLSAFLNVAVCLLLVMAFSPPGTHAPTHPRTPPAPPHTHAPTHPRTPPAPPRTHTPTHPRTPPAPPHTHAPTPPRTPILLLAGMVGGLATLVRAAALIVPAALGGLWGLSRQVRFRHAVAWTARFGAGMLVVIAPWTIRNTIVLDRPALISTNGGSTFWGANNDIVAEPGAHWGAWVSTTVVDRDRKAKEVWSLANEVERDRKEWAIGRQWMVENLCKLPVLVTGKFHRLLKPFPDSPNRSYVLVVGLGWIVLLPLSLIGLVRVLGDREARTRFIPLHAQLLTLLATTAIFYGSERFRASYEPLLAVYAAVAVAWGMGIAAKRRKRTQI